MITHSGDIKWAVHLNKSPERVFQFISTDDGREQFWAESSTESDGKVSFAFPFNVTYESEIISSEPFTKFVVEYFGSPVSFTLRNDGKGGTELSVLHKDVDEDHYCEMNAGWVSVLLALKAAVNYSIDLRNHDSAYTWEDNYVGN